MGVYQLFFFLQDFFDKLLVVGAQFVNTFAVLPIELVVKYGTSAKLWEGQRVGCLSPGRHLFLASCGRGLSQCRCLSPRTHLHFSKLRFDRRCRSLLDSRAASILGG